MTNALAKLRADLADSKSEIVRTAMANPASAKALADAMTAGLFNGMAQHEAAHPVKKITNRGGKILNGEGEGHEYHGNQWESVSGGKVFHETKVPIHPGAARQLGIDPDHVYADHAALAKKHPEYFKDSHEAKDYIEHVASRPTHILPGNQPDHKMIVRRDEENKAVALDIVKRGGKYRVRSAHTLDEEQFQKRLKSAGPGATLGVSRVDSREAKTPSRSLRASRGAPPADIQTILDRIYSVNNPWNTPILNRDAQGGFVHPADGWYQIEAKGTHPNDRAKLVQVIDGEACAAIVNRFNAEAAKPNFAGMLIDHEHFKQRSSQTNFDLTWRELTRVANVFPTELSPPRFVAGEVLAAFWVNLF